MPESRYYEAPDAYDESTIWDRNDKHPDQPLPIVSRYDIQPEYRDELWPLIVRAVCGEPAFSCGRCGDDSEPADCPDRHTFDDHGLCCMGTCLACQHRIDQGENQ